MIRSAAWWVTGLVMCLWVAGCGAGRGERRQLRDYVQSNGDVLRKYRRGSNRYYIVRSGSLYRTSFRKLVVDDHCACVVERDEVDQSSRTCLANGQPVDCAEFKRDPDLWSYVNWE